MMAGAWLRCAACFICYALALLASVQAALMNKHSFASPFMAHDHRGTRFIPHWDLGGGMIVKQSFMRLTADRLYQLGHLWSRSPLETDDFSLIMKFRVSGGHATLYGESLALYIGSDSGYSEGNLYGFREDFTGMIIAIDTNSADDNGGVSHKDVSVLANNGSLNRLQVLHAAEGCAATLRYHEARDDFNVLKASRLRMSYDAATEMVDVELDSRNTGRWRRCVRVSLAGRDLPQGWIKSARIGLVARTSATASDNHDVLSLRVFDSAAEAAVQDAEGHDGDDGEDDYMVLVHHMEHELYEVHSSLQQTIERLQEQERQAEARIAELEDQLGKQVLSKLDSRLEHLENRVRSNVDMGVKARLESIERKTSEKFTQSVNTHVRGVANGWRIPFVILLCVLLGVAGAAYKQYASLKKATRMY